MAWSISHQQLKEPELLDEFFLIIGKALYMASAFEEKCKYVLGVVKLTEYFKEGGNLSATETLAKVLKAKFLGATIVDMKVFPDFSAQEIALLVRAKDARNFIAHENANIGRPLSSISARHIHEQLARVRSEVEALVAGDNFISAWVFGIQEKEPTPRWIQEAYPGWVQQWIFGPVDNS
ncbi:hypothetical protein [Methyloferula stellata]|uniref:hypothetical protein n=1 Tax=Methyloferula stellata TaxID=876270 RepID=UPI0003726FC9|nr:hypothetical protein [Methyloferula stellata]